MKNTKVLVFGASNSKNSLNRNFATWAAGQLEGVALEIVDLNDYEMPIYSIDREKESGIPPLAQDFKAKIEEAGAILISLAEHNGNYTVAFKNVHDWVSRINTNIWMDKSVLLLATSPGKSGARSVLGFAEKSFPFMGGKVIGTFSLPQYHQNFKPEEGILDEERKAAFQIELNKFQEVLSQ